MRNLLTLLAVVSVFAVGTPLHAQEAPEAEEPSKASEETALAKAAANPIANMISLPLQLNNDFGLGPYDRTLNVLNVQPVIPLFDGKIVTRTIIPFVWIPDFSSESGQQTSGLANIVATAWYVPSQGSLMWGIGPVLAMPTGGEQRGSEKWSAGVSGLVLAQPGPWTIGALANNFWSFAGNEDADEVNEGLIQYFVTYQLGNGWYVNSAPIITVDWTLDEDKWKVPFGAGGGKVLFLGKLPVNLQAGAYYYVVKPDFGPDWQLRLQAQFMFPL
jgi:hypothetical protein